MNNDDQRGRDPAEWNEASCSFEYPTEEADRSTHHSGHAADAVLRVLLLLSGEHGKAGYRVQAALIGWLAHPIQPLHDLASEIELPVEKISEEFLKIAKEHKANIAIRATCLLRLMNRESRRLEDIAKQFGVTRAFIHKEFRAIQQKLNLKSRADKPDAAREKFRQICLARGKRKLTPASCETGDFTWNL